VRAYGGCAAQCLRLGPRVPIIETVAVTCRCDYAELPLLRARIAQAGASVQAESFDGGGVALALAVPREALDGLAGTVADITRGRARWQVQDPPAS